MTLIHTNIRKLLQNMALVWIVTTVQLRTLHYTAKFVSNCNEEVGSNHGMWLWHHEVFLHGLMHYNLAKKNCNKKGLSQNKPSLII